MAMCARRALWARRELPVVPWLNVLPLKRRVRRPGDSTTMAASYIAIITATLLADTCTVIDYMIV